MNIHTIIVAAFTILAHLVHIDHRSTQEVAFLLEGVVVDTSYFISFLLPIPPTPFTIDPSPPILAPPFDPTNAPTAAHASSSATSSDPHVVSRSVDLVVCLVLIMTFGILLCKAIEVPVPYHASLAKDTTCTISIITSPIPIPAEDTPAPEDHTYEPILRALPLYNSSTLASVASSGSLLTPFTLIPPGDEHDTLSAPGSVSASAVVSIPNFLDDITIAISPSPSFVVKAPRPKVPRNLWEGFVDDADADELSAWDDYPRPLPRTPVVSFEEEAAENIADGFEVVGRRHTNAIAKPLVRAWTMTDKEATNSKAVTDAPPTPTNSIPSTSYVPTPIPALGSSLTPASASPVTPSTSKYKPAKKTKAKVKPEAKAEKKGSSAAARVFEKCDCALQDGSFEPSSWDEFKIPVSCRPCPTLHFFPPRDSDIAKPTTRFVVDNINPLRHHSTEPNIPYVNEDIEAMFYFTGAKNVRCFDGRVVNGVVRYSISYAVVDFDTVEDAIAVFRTFQGRKDYPDSFHLRLEFVDREDKTFGGRLSRAMGPTKRSEEERKWFADFFEEMERVDVDSLKPPAPRPGFALPPRPAFFVE